jgi:2-polyprenyl-3-methyl-5-hydroxy-6-metoxy-1,4-benzoquinol methylase
MTELVEFKSDCASVSEIYDFLKSCDADFVPPLSSRVNIAEYAKKISQNGNLFEAWWEDKLIGLVALYCNDKENGIAHITNVNVMRSFMRGGIATKLVHSAIELAKSSKMQQIYLEVAINNSSARRFYELIGFTSSVSSDDKIIMKMPIDRSNCVKSNRDYDVEANDTSNHKYAYGFDFDVMHPYMIQTFGPMFNEGNLLELGSFKGDFTKHLLKHFDDVTCVEASEGALIQAKERIGDRVVFINSRFEDATLPNRYNNIVLTHVLEHIDDPVGLLKRIKNEWLAPGGRLFLVCPNANAPSRQIAVKMGLISHNTAVTKDEVEHGHRRTYTLDTLESDVVTAGLKVVHRSGIFFKALANFQWDRLLQTDIISKEYLDGCFALGQQYPDLCSSIFLLCDHSEPK